MDEHKVTLAMVAGVLLTIAACGVVMALGGGGELVAVTLVVVGGLGADQVSRLIMSVDRH